MKFDWTISLGTVLHLFGLLIILVFAYAKVAQKIETFEQAIHEIKGWKVPEALAEMRTKIDAMWDYFMNNLERRREGKG